MELVGQQTVGVYSVVPEVKVVVIVDESGILFIGNCAEKLVDGVCLVGVGPAVSSGRYTGHKDLFAVFLYSLDG